MEKLPNGFTALGSLVLLVLAAAYAQAPTKDWFVVSRERLCVTEGTIDQVAAGHLSVNVSKMRAYVNGWTAQSIELRFTYLGQTQTESALGSGEMREQLGMKLHAQDPCNLVYAIWRIAPESKLVVSVKRNPDDHSSAECGNRGYQNLKPRSTSVLPLLQSGEAHTLRAEMKGPELDVFVDGRKAWAGDVGSDATSLSGPVGIRSDNARFEFDLLAGEDPAPHPDIVQPCKSGAAVSD